MVSPTLMSMEQDRAKLTQMCMFTAATTDHTVEVVRLTQPCMPSTAAAVHEPGRVLTEWLA